MEGGKVELSAEYFLMSVDDKALRGEYTTTNRKNKAKVKNSLKKIQIAKHGRSFLSFFMFQASTEICNLILFHQNVDKYLETPISQQQIKLDKV